MIYDKFSMVASGKRVCWNLDVSSYPRLRFICMTALALNGRPEICSTPYFTVKDARLRKRNRKKNGPLFPNEETAPARIEKWMRNFVHILMVGEAWSQIDKESR